jgi:hypothetical protein
LKKILDIIIQKASWKKAVLFSVIFAAFFVVINFTAIGVAEFSNITNGTNVFDFELGYSYEKANEMLTAYGAEGREFYLSKIPLDFPFPISYMLCLMGLMTLILKHTPSKKLNKYLLLLPVLSMLCDWIENIGIIIMLNNYPNLPEWSVSLASIFGILKWSFVAVSITVVIVKTITFAYLRLRIK